MPVRPLPPTDPQDSRAIALQALVDAAPILLGLVPFGAITGVSSAAAGLTPAEAIAMSAAVFAGASQLAALQLIAAGAPLALILLTTLFINLRFLMYSATLAPYLRRSSPAARSFLSLFLVDQSFALAVRRYQQAPAVPGRALYAASVGAALWLTWVAATSVGAVLGAQLPAGWALDFAIPLTFLALLAPIVKDRPSLLAAGVGAAVAVIAADLPYNLGLILAALSGITAGAIADRAIGSGA